MTPRFKVERKHTHGVVTWLYATEDISTGTGWAIPTSLADELNRLYAIETEHESMKHELFVLQNNYQDLEIELGGALDDNAKGACAIALCDALLEGWDDPDGWDYGLSPDELRDRKRDGHRVQRLTPYVNEWIDNAVPELNLPSRSAAFVARCRRASKQPSPSKTENLPLHKVIGRTLPGESAPISRINWPDAGHAWEWHPRHGYTQGWKQGWNPLPVNDDGTVTVLAEKESE